MRLTNKIGLGVIAWSLAFATTANADEQSVFEGMWRMTSYLKADNKVRYQTEGYMMFTKTHWMHIMFMNLDERPGDFSESHHGTYEITGPGKFTMNIDIEIHADPNLVMQDTPVWYGPVGSQEGVDYSVDGDSMIIDTTTGAQIVLEKIE